MKKIKLLLLGIAQLACFWGMSQNMMINGGLEDYDNDDDNDGILDYPNNGYSIEFAIGWHNSPITQAGENSCDLIHPQSLGITGTPRTGVGCGGFAAVANGHNEYCYGTTNPLVAGQEYSVSFWIRKYDVYASDATIGLVISPTLPAITWSPFNTTHAPQVTVNNVGIEYQKVTYCFTPQVSGPHYVSFGAFLGYGGTESIYYFIDDVEVNTILQGTPYPTASIGMTQNSFCTGDVVVADGSNSSEEETYLWEIYALTQGGEVLEYTSGQQIGQVGTLDVNAVLGLVSPGDCYRIYLTIQGVCQDQTFVDFCYVDPDIEFLYDGSAVCENTPTTLSVTGDNGWTYTWSTGQSGVGLKTVDVIPTLGNATYTVSVTTPEGCTFSESIVLTVHSQNNIAPWMDGVNGTGDYTFYVNSGVFYPPFSFVSNFYNDHANENLNYLNTSTNLPSNVSYVISLPQGNTPGGQMTFSISTGGSFIYDIPPGNYYFTVLAIDNNACGNLSSEFTFNIVVGCDHCPLCVSYEDRSPTGSPLPPTTEAIECIEAGLALPVETGTASVVFQAGNSILLGPNFSAGPNFQAFIDASTCLVGCNDCCSDWNGFTLDEIPNPVEISVLDSDPTNDLWDVTDVLHPYCAYSAQYFELSITDADNGHTIYYEERTGNCCEFESRSQDNPIPHSSIWWNGVYDYSNDGIPIYYSGTYIYVLTLRACDGQELVKQGFVEVNPPWLNRTSDPNDSLGGNAIFELRTSPDRFAISPSDSVLWQAINNDFSIAPNPADQKIRILGVLEGVKYQLFDQSGKAISSIEKISSDGFVSVGSLSAGKYYIRIYKNGAYALKEFIKL